MNDGIAGQNFTVENLHSENLRCKSFLKNNHTLGKYPISSAESTTILVIHHILASSFRQIHNALPETGEGVALIHEVMPLSCYFDRVILMVLEKPSPLSKPVIVTLATYIPVGRLPASNV